MAQAAGDALDQPIYGSHYLVTFPILDADGDPVTGATGLDSEVSIDLGTFTDCTNEATELATSSGIYYLYLTGAEMTGKIITVRIQTTSAGAKTTVLSLVPVRMAIIATGTAQAGAASTITLAASTSKVDNDLAGYYVRCNNNSPSGVQYATRKIVSNVASTQVATVESAWGTNPSSATTYDILAPITANVASFAGTLPAAIGVAGYPDVNVKKWIGGTIPAVNVTGVPLVDMVDILGSSVSASTAQLGVRVVDFVSAHYLTPFLTGTAVSGASSSIELPPDYYATDFLKGMCVKITGGTGAGQTRLITASNASTGVLSTAPSWGTAPDNTSTFAVINGSPVNLQMVGNYQATFPQNGVMSVDTAYFGGTAGTFSGGRPDVNTTRIGGQVAAASGSMTFGAFVGNATAALAVDASGRVDVGKVLGTASAGAAGYVGVDWGHVNAPTTTVALSGTTIGTLTTYTGNTVQTGDSYARLGAPAGASHAADIATVAAYVDTEVAAIKAKTDLIPAAPASTTNITAGTVTTVSGNVEGSVGSVTTVSAGAIDHNSFQNGSIDSDVLAGDAIDGSVIADGALTSAKFSVSAPAAGVPSGILEKLQWLYRRFANKFTRDTSDNTAKAYADDGSTVLTTQTLSTSGTVQTQSAVS